MSNFKWPGCSFFPTLRGQHVSSHPCCCSNFLKPLLHISTAVQWIHSFVSARMGASWHGPLSAAGSGSWQSMAVQESVESYACESNHGKTTCTASETQNQCPATCLFACILLGRHAHELAFVEAHATMPCTRHSNHIRDQRFSWPSLCMIASTELVGVRTVYC